MRAFVPSLALSAAVAAALQVLPGCTGRDPSPPEDLGCPFPGAEIVENEGWVHVADEDTVVYLHNPPASGPHRPHWAGYRVHDEVVPRENWVHNLEHGAIVLLIGPTATADDRALILDAYDAIPNDPACGHRRALVTEDPLIDLPIAAVAADQVLKDELSVDAIGAFAVSCRNHGPEDVCP